MSRRGSHGGEHFVHTTFQCISSTKSQCIWAIFRKMYSHGKDTVEKKLKEFQFKMVDLVR